MITPSPRHSGHIIRCPPIYGNDLAPLQFGQVTGTPIVVAMAMVHPHCRRLRLTASPLPPQSRHRMFLPT